MAFYRFDLQSMPELAAVDVVSKHILPRLPDAHGFRSSVFGACLFFEASRIDGELPRGVVLVGGAPIDPDGAY